MLRAYTTYAVVHDGRTTEVVLPGYDDRTGRYKARIQAAKSGWRDAVVTDARTALREETK